MTLKPPSRKQKITAAYGREIVEQINRNTLRVGAGLQLQQSPNGSSLALIGNPSRERAESPAASAFKISGGDDRDSQGRVTSYVICLPPGCLTYGESVLQPENGLELATIKNPVDGNQYPVDSKFRHCYRLSFASGELTETDGVINCIVYKDDEEASKCAFIVGNDYTKLTQKDKVLAIFRVAEITPSGVEQVAHGGVALSLAGTESQVQNLPWRIQKATEGEAYELVDRWYRSGDEMREYLAGSTVKVETDWAEKLVWLELTDATGTAEVLVPGSVTDFNARIEAMKLYAQYLQEKDNPESEWGSSSKPVPEPTDALLAIVPLYIFGKTIPEVAVDLRALPTGRIDLGGGGGGMDATERTFTFNGKAASSKFYGTGDISLTVKQKQILAGAGITISEADGVITISATGDYDHAYSETEVKVLADVDYDTTSHTLRKRFYTENWSNGKLVDRTLGEWEPYHEAVEETV